MLVEALAPSEVTCLTTRFTIKGNLERERERREGNFLGERGRRERIRE